MTALAPPPDTDTTETTPIAATPTETVADATAGTTWWERRGGLVQLLLALVVFHAAVLLRDHTAAGLVALAFLLVVPGAVLLRALGIGHRDAATAVALTVAGSMVVDLVAVLAANTYGVVTRVDDPLATAPVLVATDALVLVAALVAVLRGMTAPVPVVERLPRGTWTLAVPVVTAVGALVLERTGSPWLVGGGLVAGGLVLLNAVRLARRHEDGQVAVALYTVSLALLWSYSLRSIGLYGFDVQQEFAAFRAVAESLRWSPQPQDPYGAMISITALPVGWWQLSGLPPLMLFKAVMPVVFALFPVIVYLVARRWAGPVASLVATSILFLTSSMAGQFPALARQEVALVLFGAMVLVAFDRGLRRGQAQTFVLLLSVGMVVSHYSTTYVAVLALVLARVVAGLGALRTGRSRTVVLTTPVVLAIAVMSALWTGPVTHSGGNVTALVDRVQTNGAAILPNTGGSIVSRWLGGNVASSTTPQEYFDASASEYREAYPWMNDFHYPEAVQEQFPAEPSAPPSTDRLLPGGAQFDLGTTILRQLGNLAVALGAIAMAVAVWRRRRPSDVTALVVGMVGVAAIIRLSSSVAFAYNAERLAMQAAVLFVVPLALALTRAGARLARGRRPDHADGPGPVRRTLLGAVALGVVAVTYADASGLAASTFGTRPGNLSSQGEYAERYSVNAQDLAASRWVDDRRKLTSVVFADRYGWLTLQYVGVKGQRGLFPDLAPGTIDTRSTVYASSSNIREGRARGLSASGLLSSTYQFPTAFLDAYKARVVDTGEARIYQ